MADGSLSVSSGVPNLPAPADATGRYGCRVGCSAPARNGGACTTTGQLDRQESECIQSGWTSVIDPAQAVVCESVVAAHAAHSVQGQESPSVSGISGALHTGSTASASTPIVARGEASIYLRLPRDTSYREKVWDHAAGALVLEEAGGRVSDLDGRPLDFSQGRLLGNHRGIVCTNGAIHDQVLAACRAELGLD